MTAHVERRLSEIRDKKLSKILVNKKSQSRNRNVTAVYYQIACIYFTTIAWKMYNSTNDLTVLSAIIHANNILHYIFLRNCSRNWRIFLNTSLLQFVWIDSKLRYLTIINVTLLQRRKFLSDYNMHCNALMWNCRKELFRSLGTKRDGGNKFYTSSHKIIYKHLKQHCNENKVRTAKCKELAAYLRTDSTTTRIDIENWSPQYAIFVADNVARGRQSKLYAIVKRHLLCQVAAIWLQTRRLKGE